MLNGPFSARSASQVTRVPAAVESNLILSCEIQVEFSLRNVTARRRVLDDPMDERRLST